MDSKSLGLLTVFDPLGLDLVIAQTTTKQCGKVVKQSSTKYLRFVLECSTATLGLEKQVFKGAENRRQWFCMRTTQCERTHPKPKERTILPLQTPLSLPSSPLHFIMQAL